MGLSLEEIPRFPGIPYGFKSIVVSSNAVGLGVPGWADFAMIQVLNNNVRCTPDGTPPTAVLGFQFIPGDLFAMIGSEQLRAVQFIREGLADGQLQVEFYQVTPTEVPIPGVTE